MNISWIRFKTVILYGVKQTDDVLGYGKKTDHIGVFDTVNNSHICHYKSVVLEIVDFSVVLYTIC